MLDARNNVKFLAKESECKRLWFELLSKYRNSRPFNESMSKELLCGANTPDGLEIITKAVFADVDVSFEKGTPLCRFNKPVKELTPYSQNLASFCRDWGFSASPDGLSWLLILIAQNCYGFPTDLVKNFELTRKVLDKIGNEFVPESGLKMALDIKSAIALLRGSDAKLLEQGLSENKLSKKRLYEKLSTFLKTLPFIEFTVCLKFFLNNHFDYPVIIPETKFTLSPDETIANFKKRALSDLEKKIDAQLTSPIKEDYLRKRGRTNNQPIDWLFKKLALSKSFQEIATESQYSKDTVRIETTKIAQLMGINLAHRKNDLAPKRRRGRPKGSKNIDHGI